MIKLVFSSPFLIFLVITLFFTSCNEAGSKEKEESETANTLSVKKKKTLHIYKDSELAILMREMHEEMKNAKISIESGKRVSISNYAEMLDAEPTDPGIKEPVFEAYANTYINLIDSFNKQHTNLHKLFNLSVNACISCHEVYCQGPIEMIGELRLDGYEY